MTVDFSIHDKPVVNLAFDVMLVPPGRIRIHEFYNWEHYKPIVDLGAASVAYTPEQLTGHLNVALSPSSGVGVGGTTDCVRDCPACAKA